MINLTDTTVAYIQSRLLALGLADNTNVIYLSDHGMSTVRAPQFINITALLPADHPVDLIGGSPVLQIVPKHAAQLQSILQMLRAASVRMGDGHQFTVYAPDEPLSAGPTRWHLAGNAQRIGPIVAVAADGWAFADMFATAEWYERAFNVTRSPQTPYGIHGYDNADVAMRALFVATGPAWRHARGRLIDGFDNVELYGLFWRLLGLPMAAMPPTNGSAAMGHLWDELLRHNVMADEGSAALANERGVMTDTETAIGESLYQHSLSAQNLHFAYSAGTTSFASWQRYRINSRFAGAGHHWRRSGSAGPKI